MSQQSLFDIGKGRILIEFKQNQFKRIRDEKWDFKEIPASTGIYGVHPYPAMFHFSVVRQLINAFSRENDTILDPFVGSGVVGVECLISKRNFIGYDINPLAILIAKVRCTPIPSKDLIEALQMIKNKYNIVKQDIVEFSNIDYWFEKDVIQELSKLRKLIYSLESESLKDFFKVAFSETVRRVSNTDYNEFKLLKRKKQNNLDTLKVFTEISLKNIGLLSEFYRQYPATKVNIFLENRNILDEFPLENNSIDLVITSPPYGDSKTTVAYGQFSKLSLRWLGMEEKVDSSSLGSKPKNFTFDLPSSILYKYLKNISSKDEKRAKEVFSFYKDLFKAIKIVSEKVKPSRFVCFVVGNRRVKGEELPTDKISADFFESLGFEHIETIVREISNKRMPIENAPSNIRGEKELTMRYEYIVILKKIKNN